MKNILEEIAARTRERIAKEKSRISVSELENRIQEVNKNARQKITFLQALQKDGMSYICEVKKASPSKGLIAPDFPYLAIAKEYEQAGASAISCLTEPFYFQGADQYLREIAAAVQIPVLRKDFTVDEYMIYQAKSLGASAVLIICAILDDGELRAYRQLAKELELDGEMKEMEGLEDFHEATWIHKYNGKYYLSYSDNHDENWNDGVKGDNRMRYAISDNPLGPWKSMGIYMEPTDSYTNHGSIVEYKGQWFAFYHNSALSNHDWLRSICVDKLYYNEDGTIQMVKQRK